MAVLNRKLGLLFYIVILSLFIYTTHKMKNLHGDKVPKNAVFIPKLALYQNFFFTGWNLIIQIIFLTIAILDEFSNILHLSLGIRKFLNRARSVMFNKFVVPVGLMVVTVFWVIYNYDRELIFPKELDLILPLWINHVIHTVILLPIFIEFLLPKQYSFVTFKSGFVVLTVFLAVYQTLFMSIYLRDGVFLYPVYYDLSWPQRIALTLFKYGLGIVFLQFGLAVQNFKKQTKRKGY